MVTLDSKLAALDRSAIWLACVADELVESACLETGKVDPCLLALLVDAVNAYAEARFEGTCTVD